jgi:hypothetical protein
MNVVVAGCYQPISRYTFADLVVDVLACYVKQTVDVVVSLVVFSSSFLVVVVGVGVGLSCFVLLVLVLVVVKLFFSSCVLDVVDLVHVQRTLFLNLVDVVVFLVVFSCYWWW